MNCCRNAFFVAIVLMLELTSYAADSFQVPDLNDERVWDISGAGTQDEEIISRINKGYYDQHLNFCLTLSYVSRGREVIKAFLDRGANPNSRRIEQSNVEYQLHLAATIHNFEAVEILLERGADPNVENSNGWYPLHSAVAKDFAGDLSKKEDEINRVIKIVKLLIEKGNDPSSLTRMIGGFPMRRNAFAMCHWDPIRQAMRTAHEGLKEKAKN